MHVMCPDLYGGMPHSLKLVNGSIVISLISFNNHKEMYPCVVQGMATYVIPFTQFHAQSSRISRLRLWDRTGQRHFILIDVVITRSYL